MSKTWKTRPIHIRAADSHDHGVDIDVHHDHRTGGCDLPAVPERSKVSDTNCYYIWQYNGHGLHSCGLCTDKYGRKAKRKSERSKAKRDLKDISSL